MTREPTRGAMFRVLRRLAQGGGRFVPMERLVHAAYADDPSGGPDGPEPVIRQFVHLARKRWGKDAVTCQRGLGYAMRADLAEAILQACDDRDIATPLPEGYVALPPPIAIASAGGAA